MGPPVDSANAGGAPVLRRFPHGVNAPPLKVSLAFSAQHRFADGARPQLLARTEGLQTGLLQAPGVVTGRCPGAAARLAIIPLGAAVMGAPSQLARLFFCNSKCFVQAVAY